QYCPPAHPGAAGLRTADAPHDFLGKKSLGHKAEQSPDSKILERLRQQSTHHFESHSQQRDGIGIDDAGTVGIYRSVGHSKVRQVDFTLAVKFPTKIMLRRVSAAIQNPGNIRGVQYPHPIQKNKKCRAQQRRSQRIPLPVPEVPDSGRVGRMAADILLFQLHITGQRWWTWWWTSSHPASGWRRRGGTPTPE